MQTPQEMKDAAWSRQFHRLISVINKHKKEAQSWGAWVAQQVEPPTLARLLISQFLGWSRASGSAPTLPLSRPLPHAGSLSLKNKHLKNNKIKILS